MRRIVAVTGAGSDYGIYRSVFQAIEQSPHLELSLIVCGMHLSAEYGMTVSEIERDGFSIVERLNTLLSSDTPQGIAKSMGLGLLALADAFGRSKPDLLIVLGDRYEMFAAVSAAVPFGIPIVHIHGGEATHGLIDEAFRHAMTKMSHLHFASTKEYANRIIQMGEESWRVTVSGAPALDQIFQGPMMDKENLEAFLDMSLDIAPILVTHHPTTLIFKEAERHTRILFDALTKTGKPLIVTYPNADTASRGVLKIIKDYVKSNCNARMFKHLGIKRYFSLLPYVAAMAGNSSSGIIEAASFELPVVNVGERQSGRVHARNVINTPYEIAAIDSALSQALSQEFKESLKGIKNPYGDGTAAPRIVRVLEETKIDSALIIKRFNDIPSQKF